MTRWSQHVGMLAGADLGRVDAEDVGGWPRWRQVRNTRRMDGLAVKARHQMVDGVVGGDHQPGVAG